MVGKGLKLTVREKVQVTSIRLHLWHAGFSIFSHFARAVAHPSHAPRWKALRSKFRFPCLFCWSLVFSCWEVEFIQVGFLFPSFSSFPGDVLASAGWAMKVFEAVAEKSCKISFENWQCWFLPPRGKERAESCGISAAKPQRWESSLSGGCCNAEAPSIVVYLSSVFPEPIGSLGWHLGICPASPLGSGNHGSGCASWANPEYNSSKSVKLKFWFHEGLKVVCEVNCTVLSSSTSRIASTPMSSIPPGNRRTFVHKGPMCDMSKLE